MAAPTATQRESAVPADTTSDAAASFDLFLIHAAFDAAATADVARELRLRGIEPWLAEEHGLGRNRWKPDALDRLRRLPACALVIGPRGLPGEWGRREVDEAAHRKRIDPAFHFLLVYLPEAEPVPAEALPLPPDAVISFAGGIDAGIEQIVGALGQPHSEGAETAPLSASVESAIRLSGSVTSFQIARRLLESHPEYGGGDVEASDIGDGPSTAPRRGIEQWLSDVRALYEPTRVPLLHGRLMIDGLARLDRHLHDRLREVGFLDKLRQETTPNPESLLRRKRDAVETHTDQPADVDELGRAVIAKVLATRIRRVRLRELERHQHERDAKKRRGGPLLLHLYGRWGAGKTSLLHFLRQQLEADIWGTRVAQDRRTYLSAAREACRRWRIGADARSDVLGRDPLQRWIVIDFNGWQHQRIVPRGGG